MILKNFVKDAILTESDDFSSIHSRMGDKKNIRLLHASIGMATENTELIEALKKPKLDKINFMEENGDILWYVAIACDEIKLDFNSLVLNAYSEIHKETSMFKAITEKIFFKKHLQSELNKSIVASGTCLDIMKKTIYYSNRVFDEEKFTIHLKNQIKSVAKMLLLLDSNVEYACERVIHKLQKVRYKMGKFTSEEALKRDLEKERESLENKVK